MCNSCIYSNTQNIIEYKFESNIECYFIPNDTTNYTTPPASDPIKVTKATPTITWSNPVDLVYGIPLSDIQLNASASVPGTFAYISSAGTVLRLVVVQKIVIECLY